MSNLLSQETSLYLRQHADNPVHWHCWNEAALTEARSKDVPILLSIGYSACHWCHVMAHESFEDPVTAQLMNEKFINIKVDREERPDLDQFYQAAHAVINRNSGGGWPLTLFLSPHTLTPFFAGTYFPPTAGGGLIAFSDLLNTISDAWKTKRASIEENGVVLSSVFEGLVRSEIYEKNLDVRASTANLYEHLVLLHDDKYGGFGPAPKFPMTTYLVFLLKHGLLGDSQFKQGSKIALHSLDCMAQGGVFDHVGGGFFRYSVDAKWVIPHFEKMLYDNGCLLAVYAQAQAQAPSKLYETTLQRTADWLMAAMQLPEGGYRASIDADSEEGEGAFYVWQPAAIKNLLESDEYTLVEMLFGLDKDANFAGSWHLYRALSWETFLDRCGLLEDIALRKLANGLKKLAGVRASRPAPKSDDKVICSWNGLAIKGMVLASAILNEPKYMASAMRALNFIHTTMWSSKRLHSVYDQGQLKPWDFLDDYSFLLEAILTVLEYDWQPRYATFALQLADTVLAFFADPKGGLFFTPSDHEELPARMKPMADNSMPGGNPLLATTFIKLGHLYAKSNYLRAAEGILNYGNYLLAYQAQHHPSLVDALRLFFEPGTVIVLSGPRAMLPKWQALCQSYPGVCSYSIPLESQHEGSLPYCLLNSTTAANDNDSQVKAFICHGYSCSLPVNQMDALKTALGRWHE